MLGQKMGRSMKRRHLVDAMSEMDPDNTNEVTFDMFRNWLVDTGRHWSDLLVLPEGSVCSIREKADELGLMPDTGANPALVEWQRLSVLMRLMACATEHWGQPAHMYGLHVLELEKRIAHLQAEMKVSEEHKGDLGDLQEQL